MLGYDVPMHKNSLDLMHLFVDGYLNNFRSEPLVILDVGSQIVDGDARNYRSLFMSKCWRYTGLDISEGQNVDVCVSDPYVWGEIDSDTCDVVISGQTLEHVPFFWNTVYEVGRVLRPGGLACFIAPSGGHEHRYPVDCWRFYPDGFSSLANWLRFELLDAYTDWSHYWGDSVLVMRKPTWNSDERNDFRRRWQSVMSLLPESRSLDAIAFPANASPSILRASHSTVFDDFRSRRWSSVKPSLNRLQSATLELLGPRVTRNLVESRNHVRRLRLGRLS